MRIKLFSAVFLSLLIATAPAAAQSSFDAFWKKFKTAVIKADKTTVVNLTKLPFSLGYDPSAKGGERFVKTRAGLLRRYKYIFDDEVDAAKCFAGSAPQKQGKEYYVDCSFKSEPAGSEKPFVYTFRLTKQGWRFAVFENINE